MLVYTPEYPCCTDATVENAGKHWFNNDPRPLKREILCRLGAACQLCIYVPRSTKKLNSYTAECGMDVS